jgi:hypothetical protein
MRWVWSTQVEMHFVSLLSWDGLGQLYMCYLCVFVGIAGMFLTHVEIHFEALLSWNRFGQLILRFCSVLAQMGYV